MKSAFVIPFARLPRSLRGFDYLIPEPLKDSIVPGSVVEISLRNKKIFGYVGEVRNSEIKNLKPIIKIKNSTACISENTRKLIKWFSQYYYVSPSAAALHWAAFFCKTRALLCLNEKMRTLSEMHNRKLSLFSVREDDSIEHAAQKIEDALFQNEQTLILAPTVLEAERLKKKLEKKYADALVIIHSSLGAREYRENAACAQEGTASIIIGTRLAVFLPMKRLSTILVRQSDRDEYKQYNANPRYDARTVALMRAHIEHAQVVLYNIAPRLEDIDFENMPPEQNTCEYGVAFCRVINLQEEFKNRNFSFISDELQKKIEQTLERKKTAALILNMTGYSRMVSCATCQHIFSCQQCSGIPRYSSTHALLFCSRCNSTYTIPAHCPVCKGHEYVFPGLGIEKISASIKKIFGERALSSITIETSFAFQQRNIQELGLLAFIAADPILSISNFRSCEKQWQSYARCIARAKDEHADIIVQSIHPDTVFIQSLARLNYDSFARQELMFRKKGHWPPYTRLLKILPSGSHKKSNSSLDIALSDLEELKKNPNMPRFEVSLLNKQEKNKKWTEALIRLALPFAHLSPLPEPLHEYLQNLPDELAVDIDPIEL